MLFDVDGTLYRQGVLRLLMARDLIIQSLRSPLQASRRLKVITAYRSAQERMRHDQPMSEVIADAQVAAAAAVAAIEVQEAREIVEEWIHVRPLQYLSLCRARGLDDLLTFLECVAVDRGVLSDYPAARKLDALGVRDRFSIVLDSGDPEVRALKPSPRGFNLAATRFNLSPHEVLMVGDRYEVDARGAAAAGMDCVIIGRRSVFEADSANCMFVSSLERLHRVLNDCR